MKRNELLQKGLEIDGNIFYTFKHLDNLPAIRAEAYLSRHFEFEEIGMRKADLIAFCETVEEFGNQGRFMEVQQLNGYFKSLLQRPITLYPTIYLASPLIMLNDEKENELSSEFEAKKTELARSTPAVESFFLKTIIGLEPSLTDLLQPGQTRVYSTARERIVEDLFQEAISGKLTQQSK